MTRFDYKSSHYFNLVRKAIYSNINENIAAITISNQKFEIIFETFFDTTLREPEQHDELLIFLTRKNK